MIQGHGDDSYHFSKPMCLNFSSNVYGRINLSELWLHLADKLQNTDEKGHNLLSFYPEPEPFSLETEIARQKGVSPSEVLVTNGATEAIYLIAQTFRMMHSAILQPTFSEYADACHMHDHRLTQLFRLPTASEGYQLPPDVCLLWLCNPNNPTGSTVPSDVLEALFRANPRVVFVIDGSYDAFTMQTMLTPKQVCAYPNVLLLQSLTKRYALPGLRLGYVSGNEFLLNELRHRRMPWSVNALAIEAGMFICRHGDFARFNLKQCLNEASMLRQLLIDTKCVDVWETQTHFMLCHLKYGTAASLKEYLANVHGMLIRDASNFEGLDSHYFRVASQGNEANQELVKAIRQWLAE
ncbi:MAG: aminotransferase class I/II-fold pyridoxal phosphate-dependent enzyme [Bacteroidaceae bacterium]|nr:aminotransferase class I/II-fold pyridoxal phosphate-dependent enzyme [Bacteroidaceae bacterium]